MYQKKLIGFYPIQKKRMIWTVVFTLYQKKLTRFFTLNQKNRLGFLPYTKKNLAGFLSI